MLPRYKTNHDTLKTIGDYAIHELVQRVLCFVRKGKIRQAKYPLLLKLSLVNKCEIEKYKLGCLC